MEFSSHLFVMDRVRGNVNLILSGHLWKHTTDRNSVLQEKYFMTKSVTQKNWMFNQKIYWYKIVFQFKNG